MTADAAASASVAHASDLPPTPSVCANCRLHRPHVLGRLCIDCSRDAVRRWSPAMQPTIKAMPEGLRRVLGLEPGDDRG